MEILSETAQRWGFTYSVKADDGSIVVVSFQNKPKTEKPILSRAQEIVDARIAEADSPLNERMYSESEVTDILRRRGVIGPEEKFPDDLPAEKPVKPVVTKPSTGEILGPF